MLLCVIDLILCLCVSLRNKGVGHKYIFKINSRKALIFFLCAEQGCQIVYFQLKNPDTGKFWRNLQWKMLVYFMATWYI
jgi:hypothetical protein